MILMLNPDDYHRAVHPSDGLLPSLADKIHVQIIHTHTCKLYTHIRMYHLGKLIFNQTNNLTGTRRKSL